MIRVMIVEDQKLVRSLLESYIQNEDGYQLAVSIPSAAEAPILCDTEDIDLVLMDVQTAFGRPAPVAAHSRIPFAETRKAQSTAPLSGHSIFPQAVGRGAAGGWTNCETSS